MSMQQVRRASEEGFTLIETLLALALTGLVLTALGHITAQWLPAWNRGVDRIQESELVATAMHRIAADLAAAEYVPAGRKRRRPLFEGSAFQVTFVRTALGPNTGVGLDVVRIAELSEKGGLVTVRSRTPFGPLPAGAAVSEQIHTSDPVVLLRAPLRLSFSYAGPDRVFHDHWQDQDKLPALVMLTVRNAVSEQVLAVSTVTTIHVNASPGNDDAAGKDPAADNAKTLSGDKAGDVPGRQGGS